MAYPRAIVFRDHGLIIVHHDLPKRAFSICVRAQEHSRKLVARAALAIRGLCPSQQIIERNLARWRSQGAKVPVTCAPRRANSAMALLCGFADPPYDSVFAQKSCGCWLSVPFAHTWHRHSSMSCYCDGNSVARLRRPHDFPMNSTRASKPRLPCMQDRSIR